jgi:3-hydroxypropionate dehydrogenase (NADP+)
MEADKSRVSLSDQSSNHIMFLPRKVASLGSGTIGSSWALLFAMREYSTIMYDLTDELLNNSLMNINVMLNVLAANGVINRSKKEQILKRIAVTTRLSDLADIDYIQESVVEKLDVKIQVMKSLESHVGKDAIIGSSTSSFLMSEMQAHLKHPERAIVAHPFNPPHLIPLVELVPGNRTFAATVQATSEFMMNLGKVPIVVRKEVPGFAGNRIQIAMLREIFDLLDNDVVGMDDIEKIFYAGIGLRYALMGPFTIEMINGGPGGLEQDLKHFKPVMEELLSSMNSWTSFPPSAEKKALLQVKQLSYTKGKSHIDLVKWRDEGLLRLLAHLGYLKSGKFGPPTVRNS